MMTTSEVLPKLLNSIVKFSFSSSSVLLNFGDQLSSAILLIALAWIGIKIALDFHYGGVAIGDFIAIIFSWGIVQYILNNYDGFVSTINDGFILIIKELGGNTKFVYKAIGRLLNASQLLENSYESLGGMDWSDILLSLPILIEATIMNGISKIIIMCAAAVFFVIYLAGQVLFGVGVILGPVFIPWLIIPSLSFIALSWINFLILTCLYKLISFILLLLIYPVFQVIYNVAELTASRVGAVDFEGMSQTISIFHIGAFLLMVLSLVIIYLMWQTPKIAELLLFSVIDIKKNSRRG